MSESRPPAPPSSTAEDTPPPSATLEALAGDWSEGLSGPLRAHGIPPPRLISLAGPTSQPLPESAPTPWSEPVPDRTSEFAAPSNGTHVSTDPWQMPAPVADEAPPPVPQESPAADATQTDAPAVDDAWTAPSQESVQEWQAEAAPSDWEEVRKPEAAEAPQSAPADWSSLRSGPDWSAAPASAESGADAWVAAPPPPEESQWAAPAPVASGEAEWASPATDAQWSQPSAPAVDHWEPAGADEPARAPEPIAEPASPAAAWNSPAVGASALDQLDSEPMAAVPGAAKELFGSVPLGGMLAGNDDDMGAPEELASPEEVLRPVAIDHDDPDLPEATGEPARTRAQPLAAFRPTAVNAMAVDGEHRVAVHTRGGRTLRGTMRDVDLSKSQFPLTPQGGSEPETIYRAEVKAIFFMLAPGEPPHAGDGGKVKVTFADGRMIEGVRDGADAKHGFFLVPLDAARTNTRRIYVAREATSDIKDG
jgi:hypothetical protein